MKNKNNSLDRLFRSAAQSPAKDVSASSFGLETRVIAAWKRERNGNEWLGWLSLERYAFALSVVALGISLTWFYTTKPDAISQDEMALAKAPLNSYLAYE